MATDSGGRGSHEPPARGVLDYLARSQQGRVAATVPIASAPYEPPSAGTEVIGGCAIAKTPTWFFHGALDEIVPVSCVEDAVADLRACDPPPTALKLTVYPEGHHDEDTRGERTTGRPAMTSTDGSWAIDRNHTTERPATRTTDRARRRRGGLRISSATSWAAAYSARSSRRDRRPRRRCLTCSLGYPFKPRDAAARDRGRERSRRGTHAVVWSRGTVTYGTSPRYLQRRSSSRAVPDARRTWRRVMCSSKRW